MAPEVGEPTLLCTSRAHTNTALGTHIHTHTHARVHVCSLSPSLFISHSRIRKCACTMYLCSRAAASRSRERNRESILARLRTCMRRMLAWCTGPLYVHSDVLSPSRECSRVYPVTSHRVARAYACVREHV